MRCKRILIVDDESPLLESLEMFLSEKGYDVCCALSAREGLEKSVSFNPHVIILDVRLPDMDGIEVLRRLRAREKTNVIIITAFHDMDTTIRAVKSGALEYIPKPIDVEELEKAIHRAFKFGDPVRNGDNCVLCSASPYEEGKIIGRSRPMKEIFKAIGRLSENRVTVLIEGETGTGKELIARAIHCHGPNGERPFRAVNCSTIVGSLLESELFGHEKGSFTGASSAHRGKFELAGDGTIFLDEVGEIPLELQSKLLRFLQEKEFERIGGEHRIKSAARIIAATNKNLLRMAREGGFREDLYYRLNVAPIRVPPLRDRKGDIPDLIRYLLAKVNAELKTGITKVEESALERMVTYDWPGNVRELENVLTCAAINAQDEVLPEELVEPLLGSRHTMETEKPHGHGLEGIERDYIVGVLSDTHWHLGKACAQLGISRPTLRHKLKAYGLSGTEKQ